MNLKMMMESVMNIKSLDEENTANRKKNGLESSRNGDKDDELHHQSMSREKLDDLVDNAALSAPTRLRESMLKKQFHNRLESQQPGHWYKSQIYKWIQLLNMIELHNNSYSYYY